MLRVVLVSLLLLFACKKNEPPKQQALEAKEQAVEAARKAADEATQAMDRAKQGAAEAWQRAEAAQADQEQANEENADAKARLAQVREEAAATVKLADAKLTELQTSSAQLKDQIDKATRDLASATDEQARAQAATALASLRAQRDALETTIKKIAEMKSELETSANEPVGDTP
jgi:chromosome segregation ATPase